MDIVEVEYSAQIWEIFEKLREETLKMMEPLNNAHILCKVYGSIARGDITEVSDIDIFIPNPLSSTLIEAALMRYNVKPISKQIIQATPSYAAKAYIFIEENRSYSFPLVPLRSNESEFYKFAGAITYDQIQENTRVCGVDKRLILIDPTVNGHLETKVPGNEGIIAKKLNVNLSIVLERVRILKRRSKIGRTGVYLKKEIGLEDSFGKVFNELSLSRPALRRRART